MSFSFFTWLHNEVVALRAAVARLESHTGTPESKPVPKPVDAVPPAPVDPPNDNNGGTALSPGVARWVAYLSKYGNDLWAVMKGENMSITAPDLPLAAAAGFTVSDGIKQFVAGNTPLKPADPSYDPSKTVLDSSDFGHIFTPPAGTTTTYTITGPARISLVIDGEETLGEFAKGQIDNGPEYTVGFGVPDPVAGGVLGPVGAGQHTFKVTHNAVVGTVGVEITQA